MRGRWVQLAREAGPYVACALVLWRMASWEQAMARFAKAHNAVVQAAGADLATAATKLHEDAVTHGAQQN
jgi:hypothetical protein